MFHSPINLWDSTTMPFSHNYHDWGWWNIALIKWWWTWGMVFLWHRVYRIISIPISILCYVSSLYGGFPTKISPFTSVYHSKPCIFRVPPFYATPHISIHPSNRAIHRSLWGIASMLPATIMKPSGGANLRHENASLAGIRSIKGNEKVEKPMP